MHFTQFKKYFRNNLNIKIYSLFILFFGIIFFSPASWSVDLDELDEVTMQVIEFDELSELGLQNMVHIPLPVKSTARNSDSNVGNQLSRNAAMSKPTDKIYSKTSGTIPGTIPSNTPAASK